MAKSVGGQKSSKAKAKKKNIPIGRAYINSTFNNTVITITDTSGNVIAWGSGGTAGFTGSRKSTPFAAQLAAETVASKAMDNGMRELDIYINGNLAKRHTLSSIPKQNFGDLYINAFRGFGGYMSNIRYYDYYITYSEMDNALGSGPSSMPCIDSKEMPPYFTPNWWANA